MTPSDDQREAALPTDIGSKIAFQNKGNRLEGVAILNEYGWWITGRPESVTADFMERNFDSFAALSSRPALPAGDEGVANLIERLRRADDYPTPEFIPGAGHLFGEAADALAALASRPSSPQAAA